MTNQGDASGPSLFQARSTRHTHNHNHHHNSDNLNHQHLHLHQHRRLHPAGADTTSPHIRSPPNEKLHGRQVVVVQTVSIVHYIDATGAVASVDTLTSDSVATTSLDLPAVISAGLSVIGDALPSVSLSGLLPDPSDGAPSTTTSAESETVSSSSLSASSEPVTSTPLSDTTSVFPTLTGASNSSSTHAPTLFNNHTIAIFPNITRTSSSSDSTFASSLAKSSSGSSLWTTTTDSGVYTVAAGGAGDSANGGAGVQTASPTSAEPSSEPSSGLAPETRNAVVGGVVGSVAGIALIAVILLYLLKWRRQRGQGIMLLGDGDSAARSRGFSSPGPASPGSGMGMAERSGTFAIPSALAKLSGKRAIDPPPAESPIQEKGFYRVSGKKLVSVLQSGGDGYSDPHDSIGSAASYYRDSQAFSDSSNTQPLQLGSPMRPVSGVPVFRDGPQRTPVQEEPPLTPGQRHSTFPTTLPIPDSVGRSFASRDGSRGSRFTEDA